MLLPRLAKRRPGLTLLEVLVALAIFLMAITTIWHLLDVATANALEADIRSKAARIARSKMNLVMAGRYPLASQADQPADDDDQGIDDGGDLGSYKWSIVANQQSPADSNHTLATNVWYVEIHVTRELPSRDEVNVVLTQIIMDPNVMATVQDGLLPQSSTNTSAPAGSTTPGGPPVAGGTGTIGAAGTPTGGN